MAERTFIINAPIDQARAAVLNVFTSEGWAVQPFSADTVQISRGKKGLSIAFGALMGSKFYLSQNLQFGTGPRGETLVRYLSSTGSAFIGGAIGMRKSVKTHAEYVEKLTYALQSQGILLGVQ
ncbi:hypothetical protein BKH13_03655 [Actinomyces naeslundii]|uniref:Uncharacterized protein n=1 Tax=Actinomyces naeslundii TaxID=1655 RepID=A0ABX3F0Q4_ACTNA|nr:hypothetical protein [Actinomyces naeslundii]OLO81602.1 hypothetical protein BKH11_13505 [Actinomyces naeslundii]OLO82222.1 hypothetical protein BKH12_09930 [Actinomyces naeslundii]OLO84702.1 hypothetical protein BKH13_03655 [Actinomyces naeslundii]OLO91622.1 hypothetical protein BKH10_02280 [Actinomyces naeslundii]OLO92934.1 hypothetical protein BKH09_02535 [Actinomyces naeslundii]